MLRTDNGGDETLMWVLIYVALLCLVNVPSFISPHLLDPRGLKFTQNACFSLFTHTKRILFCDKTAEIGNGMDAVSAPRSKDGKT